jgi:hypothetical protein
MAGYVPGGTVAVAVNGSVDAVETGMLGAGDDRATVDGDCPASSRPQTDPAITIATPAIPQRRSETSTGNRRRRIRAFDHGSGSRA